jgi:DNA polymerase
MRKSLVAPPGYKILVVDLSQIELRMNFWFCDELDWLDVIRKCDADPENNPDVYKVSAGNHYNIDPMMIDAGQRFFGKTMELGLGYRMGAPKFRVRCATDKWNPLFLSREDAYEAVQGYRASHPNVPVMWRTLDNTLAMMANNYRTDIKGIEFHPTHVRLPNGMNLEYPNLGYVSEKDSLMYDKGKYYGFIHGGSFLENLIQAISRIFMGECMLQVERERGDEIFSVSTTHDEGIWLVKDSIAEEAYNYVHKIMCTPPKWAPTCPMNAEGGFAREYSK